MTEPLGRPAGATTAASAAAALPAASAGATAPGAVPAAPSVATWVAEPERSNMVALRLMAWIALRCGRRVARVVLHLVAVYYVLCSPRQRRNSRRYLKRVLGRDANWLDGYRHVFAFASTVLDRVYLLRDHTHWLQLKVRGQQNVEDLLATGHGAFLMGAHLGSFEALSATGRDRPLDVTMVMYPDNARLINAALAAIAPQAQARIIALGRPESMLQVRDTLAGNGLIGVLADRTLGGEGERSGVVWLPFLGRPAPFPDGPFRLAELLRQPIIFMVGLYAGGPVYDVRFEQLADFSERLRDPLAREARLRAAMQAYVAKLEELCREMPYNWFNFHDFWHEDQL